MDNGKKNVMSEGSGSSNGETTNCLSSAARILLCDTDVESCREFHACNYEVTAVFSASEETSALNSREPQTDIFLAEASLLMSVGAHLLKYITQNQDLTHIPVIMMLVEDDASLILKGLGLGATVYIMKPLTATEILNLWFRISEIRRFL